MTKNRGERCALRVLSILPAGMSREICHIADMRRGGIAQLRELRVRTSGVCTALFGSECLPLYSRVERGAMDELVREVCDGALYSNRDNISEGYVSMPGGIRVGIVGTAKYEKGLVVGVSGISSLLFRIPQSGCAFADELYSIWSASVKDGMLIYSPPGVGKTTALRSLACMIGSGTDALQVAVIDERCEFSDDDIAGARVDVLRGYRRREGIEIATRTMSPDVVMVDELGAADAPGIAEVVRCGIPLVASAHAASYDELCSRSVLKPLINCGAFARFVGISKEGERYSLTLDAI